MAGIADEAGGGSSCDPGPPADKPLHHNTQVQLLRPSEVGGPLLRLRPRPLVPRRWGIKRRLMFVRKHSQISDTDVMKRRRTAGPEANAQTTMMDSDSAVLEFKLNYEQTKHFAAGEAVHSDAFTAGGHLWRINCYPRGVEEDDDSHLSIFVELQMSRSRSVNAIFEAFLMDKAGEPSLSVARRIGAHVFQTENRTLGWPQFVRQTDLVKVYLKEGHLTFVCAIVVLHRNSVPTPRSDIGKHLGNLLDSTDGSDVSFIIDSETFHAHRAVLAARSPVFRAELHGSIAEATMSSITLQDITPATFRVMLRFMYTDVFPADDELGDSPFEMVQRLLAAADRYALDRFKLMCAQKMREIVSVANVADALACADTHNCPELKNWCIGFVVEEKNFKKVVLTDGFMHLWQKFPSIITEVRQRVGA